MWCKSGVSADGEIIGHERVKSTLCLNNLIVLFISTVEKAQKWSGDPELYLENSALLQIPPFETLGSVHGA